MESRGQNRSARLRSENGSGHAHNKRPERFSGFVLTETILIGGEVKVRQPRGKDDMATKAKMFKTIPVGTKVSWHYRSAIGHGTVTGVSKMGTNPDNTMYSVRETDHHPGEPAIVHHSGKALSRV